MAEYTILFMLFEVGDDHYIDAMTEYNAALLLPVHPCLLQ